MYQITHTDYNELFLETDKFKVYQGVSVIDKNNSIRYPLPRQRQRKRGVHRGLWLLTNQLHRPTCKSVTPALCFGFAVDGWSGTFENLFPRFRSIPKKCHSGQMGAAIEGLMPDAGDAVRNGNALQTGTFPEGHLPDAGDAIRYRDFFQSTAFCEGPTPDTGNAIRYHDARQACAAIEGARPDAGDTIMDCDAR